MNDRVVTICRDCKLEPESNEMELDYTDKSELVKGYQHFYQETHFKKLLIRTGENFSDACVVFDSMFTRIDAAGGIVRNNKEEYLFIKRMGKWDLPKGKLYKKEAIQKGALREVTEETGLTNLIITKQLPSTFHIYTDVKGKEVLKKTYWFEMRCNEDQNLVPQLEEDITEVKWFEVSEITIPLKNTYASLHYLLDYYLQL